MPSVVIVGAGVLGASLADRLARSGWEVTLVERVAPGHVRSGSGGESRLMRCAHGDDTWHARSAARALEIWRELGPRIFVAAGVVWLARRDDGWEAASERTLAAVGVATERVDASALFPSIHTGDLAFALFEPGAGVLRAREGTRALAARAQAAGARMIAATAVPDGARVALLDAAAAPGMAAPSAQARRLEADHVVWAAGAWLPALFGALVNLRITQQDVFWFAADAAWQTPGVPAFVDYDGAAYGLGDLDGAGVKVAPDAEGPPIDAEHAQRVAVPEHERLARSYLAHRFPALAHAPLAGTRTCQYELTADTRFLAAPHPEHGGRVWLLGGGSGHAFKHGPALAERMEGWLTGAAPPEQMFALGARAADVKLRTRG